jgi:uncharacterized protein (DUF433 family)
MPAKKSRILIDPQIVHGKPVIRGTRVPVAVVLAAIAGGDSFEQVEQDYGITEQDVRACMAFAAEEVAGQSYRPLSA